MGPADNRLLAVPNVSEGSEPGVVAHLRESFAPPVALLDEHSDAVHNRTVFTLAGDDRPLLAALKQLAWHAIERIDISRQRGAHPRIGSIDVCPIVWHDPELRPRAVDLAGAVAEQLGALGLPVFLYGELASTPERRERAYFRRGGHVELARRMAAGELEPDYGPGWAHPSAGGVLVTARPPLAAFNLELGRGRRSRPPARSRPPCASRGAARRESGRSPSSSARAGCRSRPTSTIRSSCRSPRSSR